MKINLLLIIFCFALFALDTPKDPTPPSLAEEKVEQKKNKKIHIASVSVKLCDGRKIQGQIEYENEELNIKHLKHGIKYEKKIFIKDLKQFKILTWSLKKQKKVKEGNIYTLIPKQVVLNTSNEENIRISSLEETEFQILKLTNLNGKTKLYTYWNDLLYPNGNWFSKLSTTSESEREDCFPDVIRQVDFE